MKAKLPSTSFNYTALDSGSKRRLSNTLSRMSRDEVHVLFDKLVVKLAREYARNPDKVEAALKQLREAVDPDNGLPFGRSVGTYASTKVIWQKFADPQKPDFRWNQRLQMAIQKVAKRYKAALLQAIDMPSTLGELKGLLVELGTSGGWESILTGKRKKKDLLDDQYYDFWKREVEAAILRGRFNYPIVPGSRTQCAMTGRKTCKHKKRPINMVTLVVILVEALFANPVTEFLTHYSYSAIGKNDITYIPGWVTGRRLRHYSWVSLDYSQYDASLPSWLIDSAFDIIKGAFKSLDPLMDRLFEVVRRSFIVKELVTPEGILRVTHGNPSGSKFTAIINGVCNEIMTEYWSDLLERKVEYMIMGDDNLIFFSDGRSITLKEKERIADILTHKFGIAVNATKCDSGDWQAIPKFLSREWRPEGAWRDLLDLVAHLAYPERFRNYRVNKKSGVSSLTPEVVFFSYILGCKAGMNEFFDVNRFLRDYGFKLKQIELSPEAYRELPWNMRERWQRDLLRKQRDDMIAWALHAA